MEIIKNFRFSSWKKELDNTLKHMCKFNSCKDQKKDSTFEILREDIKQLNLFDFTAGRESYERQCRMIFEKKHIPDYQSWSVHKTMFEQSRNDFSEQPGKHFGILTDENESNFKNFRCGNFLMCNGQYIQDGFGIALINDITFAGNWSNNMPNGFFLIVTENYVYFGMIENNRYHGCAKIFTDDFVYFGMMQNNCFHGKGVLFDPRGYFVGKFTLGERTGFGSFHSFCKNSYTGLWKHDRFHGKGMLIYDSMTYTGHFEFGKRNGYGVCTFPNGNIYKGKWKYDNRHGQGVYISNNGNTRYDGGWKLGKKYGYAIQIFASGEKYVGIFRNNFRHGRGFLHFSSGNFYQGNFKKGIPYGHGVMYRNNKIWKEGTFKNVELHGFGKLYLDNGNIDKKGKFINGNYINFNNILIRKYLETRDPLFLKKIKKSALQKFITEEFNTTISEQKLTYSKNFFVLQLLNIYRNILKEQENKTCSTTEHDTFGNEIVHPCMGNNGIIYDYSSMLYLFKKKKDGTFQNINYVYDTNSNPVPNFPIMENGKILSAYTVLRSPEFVTPPRPIKKKNLPPPIYMDNMNSNLFQHSVLPQQQHHNVQLLFDNDDSHQEIIFDDNNDYL
jgi:hypothetical protein